MDTFRHTPLAFCLLGLVVGLSATSGAAPQPATSPVSISLERIRKELDKTPAPRLKRDVRLPPPAPTFKTRVDQRVFVPTLEEHLRREFALTLLQRQSAEWTSQCCGLNLNQLAKRASRAWQRHETRSIRQQIARELAELEAARKKATAADVK